MACYVLNPSELFQVVPTNTVLEFHRVGRGADDIRGATLHHPSVPPLGGLGVHVLDLPQVAPKLA